MNPSLVVPSKHSKNGDMLPCEEGRYARGQPWMCHPGIHRVRGPSQWDSTESDCYTQIRYRAKRPKDVVTKQRQHRKQKGSPFGAILEVVELS